MILAFTIILSWLFLVALACVIGTNKELEKSKEQVDELTKHNRTLSQRAAQAAQSLEVTLHHLHHHTQREYRNFDQILGALPARPEESRRYPLYRAVEAGRFDLAAQFAADTPVADKTVFTHLEFSTVHIWWQGQEVYGWERNGWVLFPKSEIMRWSR